MHAGVRKPAWRIELPKEVAVSEWVIRIDVAEHVDARRREVQARAGIGVLLSVLATR